jgi:uncharacterized protein (TIGR02246 family)
MIPVNMRQAHAAVALFLAVLPLGVGCKESYRMREKDEIAIRALEEAYDSAWNAGDVRSLAAAFTPDAVVVNPMGKRAQGQAEISRVLAEFLGGSAKGSRHKSIVLGIEFISDDVALVDGEATLEGVTARGEARAAPLVHRFTDLVVKRGGAWKVAQVRAYIFIPSSEP